MKRWTWVLPVTLPLLDLAWNLTHLSIGLADFYGLTLPAYGFVHNGAWPATPYFPAGYPLLLIPFGLAGSTLVGGYILSAVGGMLALAAVRRLALEFEQSEAIAALCVGLAWLMPSFRIVAGSPSVDALFTGIALWFVWCAVRIWRERAADRSTLAILLMCTAALPLLRYHAAVLILPVLLVLFVTGRARKNALAALAVLFTVMLLNFGIWADFYGGVMPSVMGIQIRNGIEADYRIKYETPELIYADYPAYVERARTVSVFKDYGVAVVLKHTAKSYYYFLRRPTIAFALVLTVAALTLRRKLPVGAGILALWALGYTLALSPAYYTPRGALLPELALLPLIPLLVALLWVKKTYRYALAAVVVLLLAAQWRAGRFARAMWQENMHFAKVSREVEAYFEREHVNRDRVAVSDARVIRLPWGRDPYLDKPANPWCFPYARTEQFWTEDPSIDDKQVSRGDIVTLGELLDLTDRVDYALMSKSPPRDRDLERISRSGGWMLIEKFGDQLLFKTTRVDEYYDR